MCQQMDHAMQSINDWHDLETAVSSLLDKWRALSGRNHKLVLVLCMSVIDDR